MGIGIFLVGFFLGGMVGMFTMGLAASARLADERTKQITERRDE